jgi:hypothetical protein
LKKELHNAHDKGYKYILSIKRLFVQLLKSFVKQGWVDKIEPDDVELVDKSFILPDFKNKEADLVYKVKIDDANVYFYLLELQSSVDYQMPYRLLLYMVEIWRNVLKETDKKEARRKDFRLPVIIPCVLYNGSNNWTAKKSFKETLFKFEQFGEFVLDFKYILIDIRRYKDEELLELANLIATIFFIDKTKDKSIDLLNRLREVAEKMQGLSSEDLNIMWNWIKNIVARGSNAKFEKDIDDIFQKEGKVENMVYAIERVIEKEKLEAKMEGKLEGKLEGEIEGEIKGIAKTAIRLLTKKFGDLPEDIRAKIIELDEDALNTIIDEIFDYESLEELNELLVQ